MQTVPAPARPAGVSQPVAQRDWAAVDAALEADGFAVIPGLLDGHACAEMIALYQRRDLFRNYVIMQNHGYGQGDYRYFADPLPDPVERLRQELYRPLVPIARRWAPGLGLDHRFADDLEGFRALCRAHGQTRPTPLLLRYGPGDYNRLHQDLYGAVAFPLQVAVLLSRPGEDFDGGEFLLVEQRPRMQSRGHAVPLGRGDGVVFANSQRPVPGKRGTFRVTMRHGVSTVRRGQRYCLGLIFHDAV